MKLIANKKEISSDRWSTDENEYFLDGVQIIGSVNSLIASTELGIYRRSNLKDI